MNNIYETQSSNSESIIVNNDDAIERLPLKIPEFDNRAFNL